MWLCLKPRIVSTVHEQTVLVLGLSYRAIDSRVQTSAQVRGGSLPWSQGNHIPLLFLPLSL